MVVKGEIKGNSESNDRNPEDYGEGNKGFNAHA
jgi:hypothetical protein